MMKLKSKVSLLSGAIILAGVAYMHQARADIFEFGTIKNGDLFSFTFSDLEGIELKTFNLNNEDYILVNKTPKTGYSHLFTVKLISTKYLIYNYTYSIEVNKVSNSPINASNYSQFLSISHVPELGEWAMILVGFGLIVYQIRRKQKLLNHSIVS
jgi:hypothetical protein